MTLNFFDPIPFQENFPVAQFHLGDMRNLIYLLLDWDTKKAAIVDPQSDLAPPLQLLAKHGFTLTDCLLTHTHFDHIAGVPQLLKSHPELKFWVHAPDAHRLASLKIPAARLCAFPDSQNIPLGKLTVQTLATPGHSAGEACYYISTSQGKFLCTGDTLFIRDCGRTDFADGSNEDMFKSLQKIKTLPLETWILPGHCYQRDFFSTLDREMNSSPPLQCRTVDELVRLP